MDENRKLHLLLKQIFGVLGSKKEDHTRLGMGSGKESSEVQGWMGPCFSEASRIWAGRAQMG